jgi:hypothetical protein
MGGMVLETNMSEILTHIEAQNKLEKSEVKYTEILITYYMKRKKQNLRFGQKVSVTSNFILFFSYSEKF